MSSGPSPFQVNGLLLLLLSNEERNNLKGVLDYLAEVIFFKRVCTNCNRSLSFREEDSVEGSSEKLRGLVSFASAKSSFPKTP